MKAYRREHDKRSSPSGPARGKFDCCQTGAPGVAQAPGLAICREPYAALKDSAP